MEARVKRRIAIVVAALLWAVPALSVGIWGSKAGDTYLYNKTTWALMDSYLTPTGFAQISPGNEGLTPPTYRPGVCYLWARYDAYRFLGTPLEAWPGGVRRFRVDSTGVQITGNLTVSGSISGSAASSSIYNVKSYGALGDGITDDTAAVLAALAAMPTDATLYFPASIYNLATWTLQALTKRINIVGDGMGFLIVRGTGSPGFLTCTKDIHVNDLTFDQWGGKVFDHSTITTVLDNVAFERVEFTNYASALYASSSVAGRGINQLKIEYCKFTKGAGTPIFYELQDLRNSIVEHNKIRNAGVPGGGARGIDLGNNTQSFAPTRGVYTVNYNTIDSIWTNGAGSNTAIALIVYGRRAEVAGNHVSWVYNTDHLDATNVDGIYTKCLWAHVHDNDLFNAGQSEGMINIK